MILSEVLLHYHRYWYQLLSVAIGNRLPAPLLGCRQASARCLALKGFTFLLPVEGRFVSQQGLTPDELEFLFSLLFKKKKLKVFPLCLRPSQSLMLTSASGNNPLRQISRRTVKRPRKLFPTGVQPLWFIREWAEIWKNRGAVLPVILLINVRFSCSTVRKHTKTSPDAASSAPTVLFSKASKENLCIHISTLTGRWETQTKGHRAWRRWRKWWLSPCSSIFCRTRDPTGKKSFNTFQIKKKKSLKQLRYTVFELYFPGKLLLLIWETWNYVK